MIFEEVPYDKLIIGKKYKIIKHDSCYVGTFTCFNEYKHAITIHFKDVNYYLPSIKHRHPLICFKNSLFYKPILKKLAQDAMERRAINKIIQKYIEYFEW
jgi:hypothetical protein